MIELADKLLIQGILSVRVYKRGVLVDEITGRNLVVNGVRDQVARLISGNVEGRSINKIAFGTNGTPPAVADTAITGQYARLVNGFSYPAPGRVQIDWELPVNENNGMAILEFGLLTVDGTLFARKTMKKPIYKQPDISIEGHWIIVL